MIWTQNNLSSTCGAQRSENDEIRLFFSRSNRVLFSVFVENRARERNRLVDGPWREEKRKRGNEIRQSSLVLGLAACTSDKWTKWLYYIFVDFSSIQFNVNETGWPKRDVNGLKTGEYQMMFRLMFLFCRSRFVRITTDWVNGNGNAKSRNTGELPVVNCQRIFPFDLCNFLWFSAFVFQRKSTLAIVWRMLNFVPSFVPSTAMRRSACISISNFNWTFSPTRN